MSQPPQDGPPQQGPQPQPSYPPQQGPQPQPPYAQQPGYPPQRGYPQQPGYPPQQPYPQQAGYPPQQPYMQQPYGGPGQPPQQPPAKKRTGLFVLIGVGALALILAVVAIAVNLGGSTPSAGGGSSGSGGSGSGGSGASSATASDAVSGFLDALAKQDAQKALGYAADPAVDAQLMTPEVLAVSAKLAPLGNVSVPPVTDKDATSVPATYTLGSTPVSTTFNVVKVGDAWKLSQVGAPVDVTSARDDSLPMLVNGVKVTSGSLTLLPGAYRFTTGQQNFDYGSRPDVVVESPSAYPDTSQLSPEISSKGRSSALKAVKKSWSSCLDKHAQKPKGCPNQFVYKDFKFRDSTVRWSRKGSDPFKKLKPRYADTTTVQYYVKRDLALRGTCTASGRTGTCTGTLKGEVQVEARLKGDKITVDWLT